MRALLYSLFQLSRHKTSIRKEVIAGFTTFAAMSYILIVNPEILSMSGMPAAGLITVTALSACIGTLLMATMTNYPIALAPGMGLNAFFAFTICIARDIPWQGALGIVFYNGIIFLLLTFGGIRQVIARAIPEALKVGVQCGIGLFIAFIGLKNAQIIVNSDATLVTLGDLSSPPVLLSVLGIVLTLVLYIKNIPGAILLGIVTLSFAGLFVPTDNGYLTEVPDSFLGLPVAPTDTFMAMDLNYPIEHFSETWDLIFALLFVNMFDTIGTLLGVSRKAQLISANGELPKMGPAMTADATASVAGAALGTSPVTSYVESAAGVSSGGRTGLTAITTAICFALALFLTPLITAIPLLATTPALVIVGILMMESIRQLDFDDTCALATAFIAIVTMPLSFSISEGIALGFIVYVATMMGCGRHREVSLVSYLMASVFLIRYMMAL